MRRTILALALALFAVLPAPAAHAAAPVPSGNPSVTGNARVGQTLTMSTVTWSATPATTAKGQHWERCDASGNACAAISGATEKTYVLAAADEGTTLRAVATATNADGSAFARSTATALIAPRQPPVNTTPPAITGTIRDGSSLSSDTGTWSGIALTGTPTRQWFRCDTAGNACTMITGATGTTYTLTSADVGSRLRVEVRATNPDGSATAQSAPTDVIEGVAPQNTTLPTTNGTAREGQTLLLANKGTWRGTSLIGFAYQWERCNTQTGSCSNIGGATGTSYQLTAADVGFAMKLTVIASNAIGTARASSVLTSTVAPIALPTATTAPSISGTPMDASTLSADDGDWTGTASITFTRVWLRCDALGLNCLPLGAIGPKYILSPADVGTTVRVRVTAKNPDGETVATSAATPVIQPLPPASNAAPSVTGVQREGQLLGVNTGTWKGTPTLAYTYQWQRCGTADASCVDIADATASTYRLVAADVGRTVRIQVTATNAGGQFTAASVRRETVTTGFPAVAVLPELTGPVPRDGETWTTSLGEWGGTAPIELRRQWLRCSNTGTGCLPISGEIGASYTFAPADVNKTVRVEVTASNAYGVVRAQSLPSPVIAAAPPIAATPPTISGSAIDGELLTTAGTWTGTPVIAFTYQWQRCDPLTSACADIPGATAATYRLTTADVGSRVRARMGASNAGGGGAAISGQSAIVAQAPPRVTSTPILAGQAVELSTLRVTTDQFAGTKPMDLDVQWQRCDTQGGTCVDIPDDGFGDDTDRILDADDRGHTMRAVISASNDAGSADAVSAASAVVQYAPPVGTIAPAVSPDTGLKDGHELEATTGAWTGSQPMTLSHQWQRCDANGTGCSNITGAATSSYVLTTADVGRSVRVVVRASNAGGATTMESLATGVVLTNPPVNVALPAITGQTQDGYDLRADDGSWTGLVPFTTRYQWWRCDATGANCSAVDGATAKTYRQVPADIGLTLRAQVLQSNVGGSTAAMSPPSQVVIAAPPRNVVPPQVDGPAAVGRTVTVDRGTWAGTPDLEFDYQWLRCEADGTSCDPIMGATGEGYMLAPEDDMQTVRVVVTASNPQGAVSVTSATSAEISDDPPVNITAPEVRGPELVAVGAVLQATDGDWGGARPIQYAYRWQRCDAAVNGCQDVTGATSSSYQLGLNDVGKRIRVIVTASNVVDQTPHTSAATDVVRPEPPASIAAPTVTASGALRDAAQLTASNGTWTGASPIAYAITWLRCDADGASCGVIPDATGSRYTLTPADVGSRVKARVTATNAAVADRGGVSRDSDATGIVGAAPPVSTVRPSAVVLDGKPKVGGRVRAVPGTFAGTAPIDVSYQWQRCVTSGAVCDDIAGATGTEIVLGEPDVGRRLRVMVTARNLAGALAADSSMTDVVPAVAPESLSSPTLDGTAQEGAELRAGPGGWTGSQPIVYAYQWERCPQPGAPSCAKIANATRATYILTAPDVGKYVRVSVTATNAGGKITQFSGTTAPVLGQAPRVLALPTVSAKSGIRAGSSLASTTGTWTGTAPLKHEYQWQRCDASGTKCADVPGATKAAYALKADDVNGTSLKAPMRVVVTTTNMAGDGQAISAALGAGAAGAGGDDAAAGAGAKKATAAKKRKVARAKSLASVARISLSSKGRLLVTLRCAKKSKSACGIIGSFGSGKLKNRLSVNGLKRGGKVTRSFRLTATHRKALRGKRAITFTLRVAAPATPTYAKVKRVKVKVPATLRGKATRNKRAAARKRARR